MSSHVLNYFIHYVVAQTTWGPWGLWSSMQVPMCGTGMRSRQRVCTNTSLVQCGIGCTLGSTDIDNQCCVGMYGPLKY